jgi:predicted phosphodiesterase
MRFAIIADIHSNLAALTTVLNDIERRGGVEEVWNLGDVVGYGPEPHQCLELLRRYNHIGVAGNHDWAAIGKVDTSDFNPDAAAACHWTAHQLSPKDIDYLESLPLVVQRDNFTLVHGSPRKPIWEYLLSISSARQNFAYFQSQLCLVGHSHVPLVFELDETGDCIFIEFLTEGVLKLTEKRLIINPGGVGQPRDGDPRTNYAIFDNEAMSIIHYRIPYDISATQTRMVTNGLPRQLMERLSYGL